ncbi:hypothetical protein [Streptomyces sp. MNP-20]|uniref:hypothetical protein n=1 Tax=Streptomyces sp. MNP-20 TaxID=2721165 RepID=UPI001551E6A8|nr:hypothetical protein [Streptomyces sp. MNP-20]
MLKRLAAVVGGLALALGGAVAAAPAVNATPQGCFYQVLEQHPEVDADVVAHACLTAADGSSESVRACYAELRREFVPAQLALEACRRSSQD